MTFRSLGLTGLALALAFASHAVDLSPGVALFEQEKYAESKAFFDKHNTGKDAEALYYLGRIALEAGDHETAEAHLAKAAELSPNTHAYVLWLGRAYGDHGRKANLLTKGLLAPKIHSAFARAVELKPDDVGSRQDLISFYVEAPGFLGGSIEKAREQAAAIDKLDALEGARAFARVAQAENKPEEGYAAFKRAADAHPENVDLAVETAIAAHGVKRWDEAFTRLEAAVKREPEAWGAWYQIGRAAAVSGTHLERGAEALERYLAGAPKHPRIPPDAPHNRLGQIYEQLKQSVKAREHFNAALQINPQNKDAAAGLQRLGAAQ